MSRKVAVILACAILTAVVALMLGMGLVAYQLANQPESTSASAPAGGASPLPAPGHLQRQRFRPTSSQATLQVLDYDHFTVGYDSAAKNPAWVVYDVSGPIVHPEPEATRPARFATDPRASVKVSHDDYTNSGYDRGHMCPSYAEFSRFGVDGEKATFITTNIIPQIHSLNAGEWEQLEVAIGGKVHGGGGWAESCQNLTIINGPVYWKGKQRRLSSGVSIPDACFSIVLDYVETTGSYRALAFQMENHDGITGPLVHYTTSIKEIEDETGLDVFAGVDPAVRAEVEEEHANALW